MSALPLLLQTIKEAAMAMGSFWFSCLLPCSHRVLLCPALLNFLLLFADTQQRPSLTHGEGALSVVHESFFSNMLDNAALSENPFGRFFKRAFSCSSSSSFPEDSQAIPQQPNTQTTPAFVMGCYLCGKARLTHDVEAHFVKSKLLFNGEAHQKEGGFWNWWQERGQKRRKVGSTTWAEANDHLFYRTSARFKRLLRRLRVKARMFNHFKKSASLDYDPLSYSMNFDDGCWQHCDSHANFCGFPSSKIKMKLQSVIVPHNCAAPVHMLLSQGPLLSVAKEASI